MALDSPSHLRYDFPMLIHLLKDVWFYVSAGGFLASLVLFIFLLGQYRLAVEAEEENDIPDEDMSETAETPMPESIHSQQFEADTDTAVKQESPILIPNAVLESVEKEELPLSSPVDATIVSATRAQKEETPTAVSKESPTQESSRQIEEIKVISEGMNKLAEQLNSLEKVFVAESRNNLKALEKISAILKEQTEKIAQINVSLPAFEPTTPAKENIPSDEPAGEGASGNKKIKLRIPKENATIVLKPENDSKTQKLEPTSAQQLELSIKEGIKEDSSKTGESSLETKVEPASQQTEKTKSPLKIKDPKDLDKVEGETLSTRKGPVWPI